MVPKGSQDTGIEMFDSLKQEYFKCDRCPVLCENRSQVVFGSGNKLAKVVFLGEAPGANEDAKGIPFCGMSGKILEELLMSVGMSREDIFITNTILCRPPKNRNPTKEEVANCSERLDKLLEVMQPKVLVTIGNFATERILGKTGIKSLRGKVFEITRGKQQVKVVPVIHPANYLYSGRNPELFGLMKSDFSVIAGIIEGAKKQKSLMEF